MEILVGLFRDSVMQSMIFGPIMGVVFAAIFAGLTARPTTQVPITVVQTRQVYVTRVIEYRGRRNDSEEGGGILFAVGVAMLFVLWKYAIFVNEIHYYIGVVLITALSFGAVAVFVAYLKGQFTSDEWWVYLVSPLILLSGCVYLLELAHSTFDPQIKEVALQNNQWSFYTTALTDYGRNFMLAHVFGVICLCLVIVFSFIALLHYLALMNQRSVGTIASVWFVMARLTMFFSGRGWFFLSGVLLVAAYIGIEPKAGASWLTNTLTKP